MKSTQFPAHNNGDGSFAQDMRVPCPPQDVATLKRIPLAEALPHHTDAERAQHRAWMKHDAETRYANPASTSPSPYSFDRNAKLVIRPNLEDYFSPPAPPPGSSDRWVFNRNGPNWKFRPVYQLAEKYCANFCRASSQPGAPACGTCEGLDFDLKNGGRLYRRWTAGRRCLLAFEQRCPYFEEAILSMEKRGGRDWPTSEEGKRLLDKESFLKAARLYRETFPEIVVRNFLADRKCPDCGKGSVEPRKQYCAKCRTRRLRLAQTKAKRTWRQKGESMSIKQALRDP